MLMPGRSSFPVIPAGSWPLTRIVKTASLPQPAHHAAADETLCRRAATGFGQGGLAPSRHPQTAAPRSDRLNPRRVEVTGD